MQTLTPYHAKYYAYELTRRCPPDSDDRLTGALVDAQHVPAHGRVGTHEEFIKIAAGQP